MKIPNFGTLSLISPNLKMELCKPQPISSPTHFLSSCNTKQLISPAQHNHLSFKYNPSLSHKHSSISLSHQGLHSYKYSLLRSTKSDDTSSESDQFLNAKHDSFENFEDRQTYEVREYGKTVPDEDSKDEHRSAVHDETRVDDAYEESSLLDVKNKIAELVDKLNLKFDSEDSYSIALYGSSAAAALYLASAVIGAIDSIPVFPKLMEVVGLGYSVWFTSRYLLFKKNRDELTAKVEEIKKQVFGQEDE